MGVPVATTRLLLATGVMLAGGLSSCGLLPSEVVPEVRPELERVEVFEFRVEPGTMTPAEVERVIDEMMPDGRTVPGTGFHLGSVDAPSGTVDVYAFRTVDPSLGPGPISCTATVVGSEGYVSCGGDDEPVEEKVRLGTETTGGLWRSAEFLVDPDVARLEASAEDGTVYTVIPVDGFGYAEWLDERGPLEVVAFDAQGREVYRTFTERAF